MTKTAAAKTPPPPQASTIGFLRGSFVFIAGFLSSQLLDFKLLDLKNALPRNMSSQVDASVDSEGFSSNFRGPINNATTSADKSASPPTTTTQSSPSPVQPTQIQPENSMFDRIVQKTYQKAIVQDEKTASSSNKVNNRPTFDITYWEKKSNLTTSGGLKTQDRVLLADIYGHATSVFEYGLGESTYIANYLKVPRYAGIDSDPVWVTMVRDKVSPSFRFSLADIGATQSWGYPVTAALAKNMWNYQLQPLVAEQQAFDVYMVDGRWRVGCMLASFLHASARGAQWNKTTVLLHDCKDKLTHNTRTFYDKADHLLDLTRHSGARLCVYKRKQDTTDLQLWELWNELADQVQRR